MFALLICRQSAWGPLMPHSKDGNLANMMMLGTSNAVESILDLHIMHHHRAMNIFK